MAHLHLLGIAGSFMAGVARLALELGHSVSGSDRAFYPPFGDAVRQLDCELFEGYDSDCRTRPADLYLVGNVVSRGNPLLESLLRDNRPFISAPQWLYENLLRERRVLAVAGTHGKTTTSALLTYLLEKAGYTPGFLVGGVLPNFALSARLAAESDYFVIEADEYDSAFFDKRPKFLHYRPQVAILNNLEFDHADIYPDVEAIIRQFHYLLRSIADNGQLIVRAGDDHLAAAVAMGCYTPLQYFGDAADDGADWHWHYQRGQMRIQRGGAPVGEAFPPPLAGAANRDNVVAAVAAAAAVGCDAARAGALLEGFRPPLRRLQLIAAANGIRAYDDFAHHPTAIAKTIAALAEQRAMDNGGGGRLIAVFEPRSNTMKAGVFREQWRDTFQQADMVIAVGQQDWLPTVLNGCAQDLLIVPDAAAAAARLEGVVAGGDDLLLMSNGDFGGLAGMVKRLVEGA